MIHSGMKYKVLFIDFFGVLIQPRSAAVLFHDSLLDGCIPEMIHIILALSQQYRLIILSSSQYNDIFPLLERHGIHHCFLDIVSSSDKALDMRRLLNQYDLAPTEAAFITDTCQDIRSAQSAGVRSYAVSWGIDKPKELAAAGAKMIVTTPQELLTVFS